MLGRGKCAKPESALVRSMCESLQAFVVGSLLLKQLHAPANGSYKYDITRAGADEFHAQP